MKTIKKPKIPEAVLQQAMGIMTLSLMGHYGKEQQIKWSIWVLENSNLNRRKAGR